LGGLARRVSYILGERSRDGAILVVDSGNLFPKRKTERAGGTETGIAGLLARAYGRMAVDAVNVGPAEAAMGRELFSRPEISRLPWISSNIVNERGDPLFDPYIIKNVGNVRVGILGFTSLADDPAIKKGFGSGHAVADPVTATRKIIGEISGKTDVILVLSCLAPEEIRRLAAENRGTCFILGGGEGRTTVHPHRESETLVLRSGKDGMYVGRLNLSCTGSMTGFLDAEEESRLHLELQNLEQRIAALVKARQNKDTPALEKMIGDLLSRKSALEEKLTAICACGTETGKFTWDLVPMESDIPGDETVLDWIREAGLEGSS